MADARELNVKISGDASGFKRATAEVEASGSKLQSSMGSVHSATQTATASFTKMTLAVAAGQAIYGAATKAVDIFQGAISKGISIAEDSIKVTEELGRETLSLQRTFGMSAESASGLIAVFNRFGLSQSDASRSLGIFEKKLQDSAEKGQDLYLSLGKVRINTMNANGGLRDMQSVLMDVADAFKNDIPVTERAAAAKELFGRAGLAMIPTLIQGRDGIAALTEQARAMGLILGQENVDEIRKHMIAETNLKQTIQGLKIQIGEVLIPKVTEVIQKFLEWTRSVGGVRGVMDMVKLGALEAANGLLSLGISLGNVAKLSISFMSIFIKIPDEVKNGVNGAVEEMKKLQSGLQPSLEAARTTVQQNTLMMKMAAEGNIGGIPGTVRQVLQALPSAIKDPMVAAQLEAAFTSGLTVSQVLEKYRNLPPDVRNALATLPQEQAINLDASMREAQIKANQTYSSYVDQIKGIAPGVKEALKGVPSEIANRLDATKLAADKGYQAAAAFLGSLKNTFRGKSFSVKMPDGSSVGATIFDTNFSSGGVVGGYADGGVVSHLSGGGFPGNPKGTDTVPAWLTPGEGVIRREIVQRMGGKVAIDAINRGAGVGTSVNNIENKTFLANDLTVNIGMYAGTEVEKQRIAREIWKALLREARSSGDTLPLLGVNPQ